MPSSSLGRRGPGGDAFSVPEQESTRRRALRTALRWRGFAPLYDALWVSPHPLTPKGRIEVADLARGAVTVFRARQEDLDTEADRNPVQAWDLPGIAEHYQAFSNQLAASGASAAYEPHSETVS
ncbi:hypothetical protein [Streptomyces sp. D2-8]|uniref:hypothetical protein n=1 Tax=Streptomyces sp. D2-8 TaxID=2707767 RepID=UPI0020BE3DB0|nr:hypothetical protein [Streptomyces sp. D2-8]